MSRAQTSASARFCGRDFSPGELERIRAIIAQGQVCRSQLARQVCQEFGWLNAQGRLKEMSCKVALLRMERAGLLVLPPPRARNGNGKTQLLAQNLFALEQTPLTLPAHQLRPLSLVLARTRPERLLYRQIMVQHHYLGYCPMAGAQLRYLLFNGSRLLGGLGFGAILPTAKSHKISQLRSLGPTTEQRILAFGSFEDDWCGCVTIHRSRVAFKIPGGLRLEMTPLAP